MIHTSSRALFLCALLGLALNSAATWADEHPFEVRRNALIGAIAPNKLPYGLRMTSDVPIPAGQDEIFFFRGRIVSSEEAFRRDSYCSIRLRDSTDNDRILSSYLPPEARSLRGRRAPRRLILTATTDHSWDCDTNGNCTDQYLSAGDDPVVAGVWCRKNASGGLRLPIELLEAHLSGFAHLYAYPRTGPAPERVQLDPSGQVRDTAVADVRDPKNVAASRVEDAGRNPRAPEPHVVNVL